MTADTFIAWLEFAGVAHRGVVLTAIAPDPAAWAEHVRPYLELARVREWACILIAPAPGDATNRHVVTTSPLPGAAPGYAVAPAARLAGLLRGYLAAGRPVSVVDTSEAWARGAALVAEAREATARRVAADARVEGLRTAHEERRRRRASL